MSEQSAKPYLVRALYEWCVDQGYTPHLAVLVNSKTRVPMQYVKDGEIILNVSPIATHKLTMDNEWVLFNARFNGVTQEIAVPFDAVVGVFAKETGYGMGFAIEVEDEATRASAQTPAADDATQSPDTPNTPFVVVSTDRSWSPKLPAKPPISTDELSAPPKTKPTFTIVK